MCAREVCKGWKGNMLSVVCAKLNGGSRRVARGVQVFRERKRNEREFVKWETRDAVLPERVERS